MSSKLLSALAVTGGLWTGQACADETSDNIRCMMVALTAASSQDATVKTAGTISTFYWMGRLDGQAPDLDLEKRLLAEIAAMKPADYQAEAARCGAVLQARGKFLSDMGRDMQQKAAAMNQQENTH
jgi:hypothetical protein